MSEKTSEGFAEKPLPPVQSTEATTEFSAQPLPAVPAESVSEAAEEREPNPAQQASLAKILELRERANRGANWFFWVAALSVVNSVSVHGGATGYFVVGLGVTLLVDGIAKAIGEQNPELDVALKVFGIGFAAMCAIVVAGFGWLARRGVLAVFAVGMFLYLLDGLLFLLLQDLLSVAFHGFALFWMWGGFSALRQIDKIEADLRDQLEAVHD